MKALATFLDQLRKSKSNSASEWINAINNAVATLKKIKTCSEAHEVFGSIARRTMAAAEAERAAATKIQSIVRGKQVAAKAADEAAEKRQEEAAERKRQEEAAGTRREKLISYLTREHDDVDENKINKLMQDDQGNSEQATAKPESTGAAAEAKAEEEAKAAEAKAKAAEEAKAAETKKKVDAATRIQRFVRRKDAKAAVGATLMRLMPMMMYVAAANSRHEEKLKKLLAILASANNSITPREAFLRWKAEWFWDAFAAAEAKKEAKANAFRKTKTTETMKRTFEYWRREANAKAEAATKIQSFVRRVRGKQEADAERARLAAEKAAAAEQAEAKAEAAVRKRRDGRRRSETRKHR